MGTHPSRQWRPPFRWNQKSTKLAISDFSGSHISQHQYFSHPSLTIVTLHSIVWHCMEGIGIMGSGGRCKN